MNNFVQSGNFTKFMSILFLSLIGIASASCLMYVLIAGITVNPAVYAALGSVMGVCVTFFSKASGIVDGAAITQNAVNSVTAPMQAAINATPGPVAQGAKDALVVAPSNTPVAG